MVYVCAENRSQAIQFRLYLSLFFLFFEYIFVRLGVICPYLYATQPQISFLLQYIQGTSLHRIPSAIYFTSTAEDAFDLT